MDLYCARCGEPEMFDYVMHEMTVDERVDFTTGSGCTNACKAAPPVTQGGKAQLAGALYDLLGDDLDGAASMFDDARSLGML